MRSVTDQLDIVLAAALTPPPVRVAISEAQGLLCAEEVVASAALPAFDQAAVDGYAVRSVDIQGASPVNAIALPVVGEIECRHQGRPSIAAASMRLRRHRRSAADHRRRGRPAVRR